MATINLGAIKFNWKGAYNNSTAYAVDDVVSSGGSSYVCILASTGNAVSNGTYWEQMSAAGTNGTNGTDVGTVITTQGDILYRDGSGLQRLAKGTAGKALVMNSGATAPEWGTVAGGKVLQVVSVSDATTYTGSPGGSTFVEPLTALRAVITPSATSSKIFIMLTLPIAAGDAGNVASGQLAFDTAGGSSNVIVPPNSGHQVDGEYAHMSLPLLETSYDAHSTAYSVLHSPNTTSTLTYKFRGKSEATTGNLYINRTIRNSTSFDPQTVATITAMEIGV
jgi:hypothetical protein